MTTKPLPKSGIEKQSRDLALISGLIFWLTAIWLFASVSYVPLKPLGHALVSPERDLLETAIAFGDIVIVHLPLILAMCAVYTARNIFVQFSHGEVFTEKNGASLTRVGDWMLASALAALAVPALTGGSGDGGGWQLPDIYMAVVMVLFGLAIRLIGRTFAIAAGIKNDNDQIL